MFNEIRDFYNKCSTKYKISMYKTPFQASECYSPTSSQARVLVVQASIAAYLQDLPSRIFSYNSLNARKRRNHFVDVLRTRTTSHVSSTKNSLFFGSRVAGFASNPSCLNIGSCVPFSTRKPQAKGVPEKDYLIAKKGHWVISPNYRVSHPRRFCAVGDIVAQRHDVLRDWLWDACHMAGVRWGSRCKAAVARKAHTSALSKAQGSCHKTSDNQP